MNIFIFLFFLLIGATLSRGSCLKYKDEASCIASGVCGWRMVEDGRDFWGYKKISYRCLGPCINCVFDHDANDNLFD